MADQITAAEFGPDANLPDGLFVAMIDIEGVDVYAPHIQTIMHDAYSSLVELELVTQADVDRQFDPSDRAHVRRQEDTMRDAISAGSVYRVAHLGSDAAGDVVGLIKTSLSRPRWKLGRGDPNLYVNDIATNPRRNGIGSRLMRVAVAGVDDSRFVIADAQAGNTPSRRWFENSGFRRRGWVSESLAIGSVSLKQVRYRARAGTVKEQTSDIIGSPPRYWRIEADDSGE